MTNNLIKAGTSLSSMTIFKEYYKDLNLELVRVVHKCVCVCVCVSVCEPV